MTFLFAHLCVVIYYTSHQLETGARQSSLTLYVRKASYNTSISDTAWPENYPTIIFYFFAKNMADTFEIWLNDKHDNKSGWHKYDMRYKKKLQKTKILFFWRIKIEKSRSELEATPFLDNGNERKKIDRALIVK
jgi:hypothetical protein